LDLRRDRFDLDGRLVQYPLGVLSGGSGLSATPGALSRTVSYDLAGRVLSFSNADASGSTTSPVALAANQSFSHDGIDRLTAFTPSSRAPATLFPEAYGYDLSGNRDTFGVGANNYAFSIDLASNRLDGISGGSAPVSLSYDAAGNMLSDGSNAWTYSDRGRMASSTNAAGASWNYFYNATGFRTLKEGAGGQAVRYVRDPQGHLLGEFDSAGNLIEAIVWLGDQPVAAIDPDSSAASGFDINYIFTDHINAPRVVVRSTDNAMLWSWIQADPFGRVQPDASPQGLSPYAFDLRLPGQVHDNETGLDQNNARDYDSAIGKYVESDPLGLLGGLNTYAYANSNPLLVFDPFGTDVWLAGRGSGSPTPLHETINIGDYSSGKYQTFSFEMDLNHPPQGVVYQESPDGQGGKILVFKKTTPAQDAQFLPFVKNQVGGRATYLLDDTCISWSERQFSFAPGVVSTPPAQIDPPPLTPGATIFLPTTWAAFL
jgi:RHS repeat-associated protein